MTPLFEGPGNHELYERLRNPSDWVNSLPGGTPAKRKDKLVAYNTLIARMHDAWLAHERCSENNFLDGFRESFWPAWFELRVQNILSEFKLENKATNGEGEPDFIVHRAGRHICDIEATVLTPGNSNANSVRGLPLPDYGQPVIQEVSETVSNVAKDGQILGGKLKQDRNPFSQKDFCLRLTGTMANKLNQVDRWKNASPSRNDSIPTVIAISSAQTDYELNRPVYDEQFELALYGKDDLRIPISRGELAIESAYFAGRESMMNKNESIVKLGLFHMPEYQGISAVVHFPETLLEYGNPPPVFFLNHNADTEFSVNDLPVGTYKTFDTDRVSTVRIY